MQCSDCGHQLGEIDLAASCCQSCLEPLLPEDLDQLRSSLGIEKVNAPEIEIPKIQSSPIPLDEFVECPNCQVPLMGDELEKWRNGGKCFICGYANPDLEIGESVSLPNSPDEISMSETISDTYGPNAQFYINSYPLQGTLCILPFGVIGRDHFINLPSAKAIESKLAYMSKEHVEINVAFWGASMERTKSDLDAIQVMDMGSTNGTLVDGTELIGLNKQVITYGTILTIGHLNLCFNALLLPNSGHPSLAKYPPILRHEPSGIEISLKPNSMVHLGRLTKNGDREAWFRVAHDVLEDNPDGDSSILEYISRSHVEVDISVYPPQIITPDGKEEWESNFDGEKKELTLEFAGNRFILHNFAELEDDDTIVVDES